MKTLRNHTLVYDNDCPMCDLYTRGFIKAGMLDSNGRVPYGQAKVPVLFDNTRARNEIALIDYDNGTVSYGLESLIKVIGCSFPVFGRILTSPIVRAPLNVLYSFISYNRKVIAPPTHFEKRGACTPAYHVGYRIAYILFAWLFSSLIISGYAAVDFGQVSVANGAQIVFQVVFVRLMTRDKLLHYIGNMMTVSLIGGLLLLPIIILGSIVQVTPLISCLWITTIVTFMMSIHWSRLKWLGLPGLVHVLWVASVFLTSVLMFWI